MLSFKSNPFTWDKSAKAVKSSVVDFKLKASGGTAMNISRLPEPVEIFIALIGKSYECTCVPGFVGKNCSKGKALKSSVSIEIFGFSGNSEW